MQSGFHRFAAIAGLLAVTTGAASPGLAGSKSEVTPDAGLIVSESAGPGPVIPFATLLSSGFEASEGFVLGPLEPQNGYAATGTNLPWVSVASGNAFAGTQHMRMVNNAAAAAGSQHVVLSPSVGALVNVPGTTIMQIFITNTGGSDYDFVGQAPSQAFLSWRVKFSFLGNILVLDDLGAGLAFIDTGVLWTAGTYTELKVEFDPAASQIRYYYGGSLIYTGNLIFAGTAIEQVVWVNDNFQLPGEYCDIDGLVLTDTPTGPTAAASTSWGRLKATFR